jgi:dGTPase
LIPVAADAWVRHPLTFLVEAADDICYSIIDLEDGCRMGLVPYRDTVELLANILKDNFKPEKLDKISGQNERIGVLRAMTINKLVEECTEVFLAHEQEIMDGTFDKALADHCSSKDALEEISSISVDKIYRARHVVEIEASGHEVLPGEHIMKKSSSRKYKNLALLLPVEMRTEIEKQLSTYEMLRIVLDFVSGLTDRHALSLYRRIKGIAL